MTAPAKRTVHDEVAELLGAYALDALEPREAAFVEAHLAECPRCSAEVAHHREVAGLLANTGADAPAELWDRIADRLGPPGSGNWERLVARLERPPGVQEVIAEDHEPIPGDGPDHPGRTSRSAARAHRQAWRRAATWGSAAVATAAAVLAVVFGVRAAHLNHRVTQLQTAMNQPAVSRAAQAALEDPTTKRVRLLPAGGSSPGGPTVTVAITPAGAAYLRPQNLPILQSDQTYQLWAEVRGHFVSLRLLGADPTTTEFTISPGAPVTAFAITTEPAGGAVQPTQAPTVEGSETT